MKKPKARPKPETECFYCKWNGHRKRNYPKYLADKKDGKVNISIYYIHVIDVYFTSIHSSTWVFDTGSVAMTRAVPQIYGAPGQEKNKGSFLRHKISVFFQK